MAIGYIKLHRNILDNPMWLSEKFTKGQAWVDLLLMANHKDNKVIIDYKTIVVNRGSFITSIHKLADRWGWAVNTVKKYLNFLEGENMIHKVSNNRYTHIDIVNYAKYQDKTDFACTQDDTQVDTQVDRQNAHSLTPNKNDKNDKNEKNNKSTKVLYEKVTDMFHTICVSYPQIRAVSDKRKRAIKSILNKYSLADVQTVFEKAEASDFLKGNNGGWAGASFDWLIKEANFIKTLEGNYDNKRSSTDVNDFFSSVADWVNERSNV